MKKLNCNIDENTSKETLAIYVEQMAKKINELVDDINSLRKELGKTKTN